MIGLRTARPDMHPAIVPARESQPILRVDCGIGEDQAQGVVGPRQTPVVGRKPILHDRVARPPCDERRDRLVSRIRQGVGG